MKSAKKLLILLAAVGCMAAVSCKSSKGGGCNCPTFEKPVR